MLLTAHGGALGTGRNTQAYFDKMALVHPAVVEVDIRMRGGVLVCAHNPQWHYRANIPLSYVFEYVKKHGMLVNCDCKEGGMMPRIMRLARSVGMEDSLIFTGRVRKRHLKYADCGAIYVNKSFYRFIPLKSKNLERIWGYIRAFGCPHIVGLNINYKYATDEFLARASELGIPISVYTVDDKAQLARLIKLAPANITTNCIDEALVLAAGERVDA